MIEKTLEMEKYLYEDAEDENVDHESSESAPETGIFQGNGASYLLYGRSPGAYANIIQHTEILRLLHRFPHHASEDVGGISSPHRGRGLRRGGLLLR